MLRKITLLLLSALFLLPSTAQSNYQPSADILKSQSEFQDDKFGVFIHWGVYAMLATGEWTMTTSNLNFKEYGKLAEGFYPSKFDADEWVTTIKNAGAKYICITTRHHDGFSMFDSSFSDFTIMKSSPFKRDVIKELADACLRQDIKLHLYYSHIDWTREDAPRGMTGRGTGRDASKQNWKSYYQFMNNQLSELLTNYGPIRAIWFDGWWDQGKNSTFDWELPEQYALIHKLQPGCMVANNHHVTPFEGEDMQIFERDLPGENKAGMSGQDVAPLPLETCETMNGMWGYKITDQNYKSPKTLIHYLVKAAGRNANLLLNVGPQPNGKLPAQSVDRLADVGKWIAQYGETIYGTRGGLVSPRDWGVTTLKENRLYVHILNLEDSVLFLPLQGHKVQRVVDYQTRRPLKYKLEKEGLIIYLAGVPTDIDHVVEVILKR